jgi:hypothetical protein
MSEDISSRAFCESGGNKAKLNWEKIATTTVVSVASDFIDMRSP